MCIFCGGACGGIGDMLLPTIVTGAGLVVLKIKARRDLHKGHSHNQDSDKSIDKTTLEQAEQSSQKN
jgi:hypothetical protein